MTDYEKGLLFSDLTDIFLEDLYPSEEKWSYIHTVKRIIDYIEKHYQKIKIPNRPD